MKVTGPSGTTSNPSSRTSRTSGGGFSLPSGGASGASAASAASATGGVAGVSALMALQGVEDATERRRRAMRRGGGLLDRLDELKLMMLAGQDGICRHDRGLAVGAMARSAREFFECGLACGQVGGERAGRQSEQSGASQGEC